MTRRKKRITARARQERGASPQTPGDGDGGMGGHMGAEDEGNDFGRYGGTRTRPEDTKQNANPALGDEQLDREVGRTDAGPRDAYGRPVADGRVSSAEEDQEGQAGERPAGGYAQDQRAADDTLGGYGGVAGGVDSRPQKQPGLAEGRPARRGEAEGQPADEGADER